MAVFRMGLGVELDILKQSIQPGKAQGSKVPVTLPQRQYSNVSMMLVHTNAHRKGIAKSSLLHIPSQVLDFLFCRNMK